MQQYKFTAGLTYEQISQIRQDDDYKMLNKPQFDAVTQPLRSYLVLAGAGSGKTSVLVKRIVYAITHLGVKPEEVMAVTFTNKAAQELKWRVKRALQHTLDEVEIEKMHIGTFHGLSFKMLREPAFNPANLPFIIWDEDDIERKLADLLHKGYNALSPLSEKFTRWHKIATEQFDHYCNLAEEKFLKIDEFAPTANKNLDRIDNYLEQMKWSDPEFKSYVENIKHWCSAKKILEAMLALTEGKKTVKCDGFQVNVSQIKTWIMTFKESGYNSKNIKFADEPELKTDMIQHEIFNDIVPKFLFDLTITRSPSLKTYRPQGSGELLQLLDAEVYKYLALEIFREYEDYSEDNHLLDFSDLINKVVTELTENDSLQKTTSARFKLIMVDEFQDTNKMQYRWLQMLTNEKTSVMVVGDDDQSIYGWRGAHPEYMQYFLYDFQHPISQHKPSIENHQKRKALIEQALQVIKLEQNYRSSANILHVANNMIKLNKERMDKTLYTRKNAENLPIYTAAFEAYRNQTHQIPFIIEDIKRTIAKAQALGKEISYNDFAILYRQNITGLQFQKRLLEANIPLVVYGAFNFYKRKTVKAALNWLDFSSNLENDFLFEQTFKHIPATKQHNPAGEAEGRKGFSTKMIDELKVEKKRTNAPSLVEALIGITSRFRFEKATINGQSQTQMGESVPKDYVSPFATEESGYTLEFFYDKKKVKMLELMTDYLSMLLDVYAITSDETLNYKQYAEKVLNTCGLLPFYRLEAETQDPEAMDDLEWIEILITQISERSKDPNMSNLEFIRQCLYEYRLATDKEDKNRKEAAINLMTIHASKGLEFKYVYLVDMNSNFPSYQRMKASPLIAETYLEEERRLFYVAITRAKEKLVITATGEYPSQFYLELLTHPSCLDNIDDLGVFSMPHIPFEQIITESPSLSDEPLRTNKMLIERERFLHSVGRITLEQEFKNDIKPQTHPNKTQWNMPFSKLDVF